MAHHKLEVEDENIKLKVEVDDLTKLLRQKQQESKQKDTPKAVPEEKENTPTAQEPKKDK